ncbi:MAG: SDR family oxidoreductase [Hyphomonadaceae bacterium]
MGKLDGKTALVLGAATDGNMGQVIARAFASEGAQVMVAGRNEAALAELSGEINGRHAICDITQHADLKALTSTTLGEFGRIDIAVNAVGWGLSKSVTEIEDKELEQMVSVQFTGVHYFLSEMVRAMIDSDPQGGSIIQISSATTTALINNYAAYIGTKTGADALVRCVANDYGQYGIRANSISPALTRTPMTQGSFGVPGLVDAFLPKYPLGRLNTADDIAKAAIWLGSDDAFISGQNIQANGGLTLRGNPQAADIGASIAAASKT